MCVPNASMYGAGRYKNVRAIMAQEIVLRSGCAEQLLRRLDAVYVLVGRADAEPREGWSKVLSPSQMDEMRQNGAYPLAWAQLTEHDKYFTIERLSSVVHGHGYGSLLLEVVKKIYGKVCVPASIERGAKFWLQMRRKIELDCTEANIRPEDVIDGWTKTMSRSADDQWRGSPGRPFIALPRP